MTEATYLQTVPQTQLSPDVERTLRHFLEQLVTKYSAVAATTHPESLGNLLSGSGIHSTQGIPTLASRLQPPVYGLQEAPGTGTHLSTHGHGTNSPTH